MAKKAEPAAPSPEAVAAAPEAAAIAAAAIPLAPAMTAPAATADELADIVVQDAEIFRPKELPLLITSKEGWKNDAQAEYAGYLNGYAYKNPKKFAIKKATLLKRLVEIGNDPEAIVKYRGNESGVTFKNNLTQVPEDKA